MSADDYVGSVDQEVYRDVADEEPADFDEWDAHDSRITDPDPDPEEDDAVKLIELIQSKIPILSGDIMALPVISWDRLERMVTDYVLGIIPRDEPLENVGVAVHHAVVSVAYMYNENAKKGAKHRIPREISDAVIIRIILDRVPIRRISYINDDDPNRYLVGVYAEEGKNKGIYDVNGGELNRKVRLIRSNLEEKDVAEIEKQLKQQAEVCDITKGRDKDLVPVNNGIFNYRTKELLPFSPEFVFVYKITVDFNPHAENPIIENIDGTFWDIESWILEMFPNNPNTADVVWHIIGAIIRPGVSWNKAAFLYSKKGNNGKGTICKLMRRLIGERSCVSIQMSDMGKNFILEQLIAKIAIVTDENNVADFIDKSGNLKAVITHDPIQINRKHKTPITFVFQGFMVQCVNELPKTSDKTGSIFRRQLYVPFDISYTGKERQYIKDDYVTRQDVLQYVLKKVLLLMPSYYELPESEACKALLEECKLNNDPVRQFWLELKGEFKWTFLPYKFLYALFKAWHTRNIAGGRFSGSLGRNTFINRLNEIVQEEAEWIVQERESGGTSFKQVSTIGHMDVPEPLLVEYCLRDWQDLSFISKPAEMMMVNRSMVKPKERGLLRKEVSHEGTASLEEVVGM